MVSKKGQIGLQLAERSKPTKGSFDYRSGPTQRWVEQLPVGNIGETAKQLFQVLQEVNRLNLSWKDRSTFLELLRQPIAYVQKSLARHYTGISFPLQPKTQRIATLAETLYSEMALGYKTAIEDMLAGNFLTRDNKALTQQIHRAVRYTSQGIITSYQVYAPHRQDSWRELHQLYLFAADKKIHQDMVHDEHNTHMSESSIARVYKQILLLALASPYRLRQGEAETIYSVLIRWAGHVHILPYNHPEASEALFVIHMDSDEAPDYQSFSHRDCDNTQCCLVDTRQLSRVLQEEYEQLKGGKAAGQLSSELLFRLICAWGTAPKRHFNRTSTTNLIDIVVGTTMLHHVLSKELGDTELMGKRATYESKAVVSANQPRKDDIWNIYAANKSQKLIDEYNQVVKKAKKNDQAAAPTLRIQQWEVRNESAGGYRLCLGNNPESKVQVGELLGLRPKTEEQVWGIGVVRWLRQSAELGLEVGVQILAPQARPAMVKNEQAGGRASELQYALLLPETQATKQPASIITPILLFQPGNELMLHMPGHHITMKLEETVQDTGTFVQFRYSYLGDQLKSRPRKENHEMGEIWDDL